MILVLGKSALSVPDTRFSRVSGSTLIYIYIFHGAQTCTMCIFQPFTVELHSCSYVSQSTVIGFRKRCFVLVHSEVFCGSVL